MLIFEIQTLYFLNMALSSYVEIEIIFFLYIFLLVYMDFEKRATALNGAWGMTFVRVRIQKVLSEGVQL